MDDAREAFTHAARPGWRDWAAYIDTILDEHNAWRTAVDVADLEALYRDDTSPAPTPAYAEAHPFDHGADWSVP